MAKSRPYLKYEPRLASFEDTRFQIERLVRAINDVAARTGLTTTRTSSSGASVPSGGGSVIAPPVDLSPYELIASVDAKIAALDNKSKRIAFFMGAD